jgi:hypothetical protein
MFFLGMTVTFLLRVNINLAIVGMVNSTSLEPTCEGARHNTSQACLPVNDSVSTKKQVLVFLYKHASNFLEVADVLTLVVYLQGAVPQLG